MGRYCEAMCMFVLQYFLVDDTLEVREVHTANDGRDPFPVLIGRHKVPKNRWVISPAFVRDIWLKFWKIFYLKII